MNIMELNETSRNVSIPGRPTFASQGSEFDAGPIYAALYWVVFVGALCGNSLVLCLGLTRRIRSSRVSTFLICSLATADLLLTLTVTWSDALKAPDRSWRFGITWCKVSAFVRSMTSHASIGTLAIIAIERFLKVVAPPKFHITLLKARLLVAYVWIHVAATNSPTLKWTQTLPTAPGRYRCAHNHGGQDVVLFSIIIRVVNFFIPLVLTWFAYTAILIRMKVSENKVAAHSHTVSHQPRSSRRVTLMCISIMVSFTIAWTPFQVNVMVGSVEGFTPLIFKLMPPLYALATLNSLINPIIYGFMWKPFQVAARKFFRCPVHDDSGEADMSQDQARNNVTLTTNSEN